MSLATLALRLAIVEALAPAAEVAAANPTWPTIAKHRVFDSAAGVRSPSEDPTARLVTVAVYSVDAEADARGEHYGFDAALTNSTIAIECDVTVLAQEGDDIEEGIVASDPASEAILDLVAGQIVHCLELGPTGAAYREIRTRLTGVAEMGMRDETTGARYARRTLRLTIAHPGDDWSTWRVGGLPWPASLVASLVPTNGYAGAILAQVAAALGDPAALTPLDGIDMGLGMGRVPDDLADADARGTVETD